MKGILARKIGMTQVIVAADNTVVPVTLLEVPENKVLQMKSLEKDGYTACVLAAFERNKEYKNVGKQYKMIQEIPASEDEYTKGDILTIDLLKDVQNVKITSTSKGRGFAGVFKRHNFHGGRATHGSKHHREPGSVGTCAKPGRIVPGKKLPGHYGAEIVTLRSVKVIEVDIVNRLIAVKGAVPGAKNTFVTLIEA